MRKVSRLFILIVFILVLVSSNISIAYEEPNVIVDADMLLNSENTENGIMLLSEESDIADDLIINNDVYKIETQTILSEVINGDVYIISDYVDIKSSHIDGNVFIIANNVKISGNINGYMYIISQNIEISGMVQGVYAVTSNMNIADTGIIRNDAKVVTNNLNLNGTIYRNAYISSENINIISNEENKNIYGSLSYEGNLQADENLIAGEIIKHERPTQEVEEKEEPKVSVTNIITNIVTGLIIITIIVFAFENKCKYKKYKVLDLIVDTTLGFGILVGVPILCIILLCTIIGIPLSLIALLLYIIVLLSAISVTSIEIANYIMKKNNKEEKKSTKILIALIIYAIFEILNFVPVLGGIINFLAMLFGIRHFMLYIFFNNNKTIDENKEVIINN